LDWDQIQLRGIHLVSSEHVSDEPATLIAWFGKRRECGDVLPTDAPAFAEVMLQQPSYAPFAAQRAAVRQQQSTPRP
jgi:hypothetical protein